MPDRVLIFVSGGPDSATLVKWARANGYNDIQNIYYRTGHVQEKPAIAFADFLSSEVGVNLEIINMEPVVRALGSTELINEAGVMPFGLAIALSVAVTYAKKIQANKILLGIHADDAAENVEYRRSFINNIQALAQSTQGDIQILTPFLDMDKSKVFTLGAELGVDFSKTWSCSRAGDLHCGFCGSCRARAKAFADIGQSDKTKYAQVPISLRSATGY